MNISGIKILIWDFDGTFYRPKPELFHAVRESEYRTIMECNHWDRDKAISEFEKYYKKVTPSATQTVAHLCGITTPQAADIMESYFDRRDFLSRDTKLVELFEKLSDYTHYILANGTAKRIRETLVTLGVAPETFREIITAEISGENKPDERGYRYIMKKTGLVAAAHLMIGDREAVDLVPAKAVGMKTCLVWSEKKSESADVTVPTIYDLPQIFLHD